MNGRTCKSCGEWKGEEHFRHTEGTGKKYKNGLYSLCRNCENQYSKDKQAEYRRNFPGKNNKIAKKYRDNLRSKVFFHYSNGEIKCAICGFNDKRALQLDHIHNDGYAHRKLLKNKYGYGDRGGVGLYRLIVREKFPPIYQVLCANCNWIKKTDRSKNEFIKKHGV